MFTQWFTGSGDLSEPEPRWCRSGEVASLWSVYSDMIIVARLKWLSVVHSATLSPAASKEYIMAYSLTQNEIQVEQHSSLDWF